MRLRVLGKSIFICLLAIDDIMKEKNNCKLISFPEGFTEPHLLSEMSPDTHILVGFSGGADSRALLDLLVKYSRVSGAKISAAHVNHCIRGAEADRDEEFCRSVAEKYGIPFFVNRIDIPAIAKASGKSVELCARDERYAFFAKIMSEGSIPILATAHNANDNLETMLFNLIRGSGLSGLCGIPQKRECLSGVLVRPILLMSRDAIVRYCGDNGLDFVTDSTNTDTDYTRNKIRANIIPVLKEITSSPERKAADASALLRRDDELLSAMADELTQKAVNGALLISDIHASHEAISSRAIIKLFARVCDVSLEQVHVNDILRLCKSANQGARISLPCGFCAVIDDSRLKFVCATALSAQEVEDYVISAKDGENYISQTNAEIIIGKSHKEINIYKKSIKFDINSAKINGALTLRKRLAGDRIFMGGMHKSIKKLMCDKKVPTDLRDRIPIICCGDEIIAVPFVGVCDKVDPQKCVKDEAQKILPIQFYLY